MTNQTNKIKIMTISALLSAIGFLIPIVSPIKIMIEPASFTLASHVPIFIAMFISPVAAISVAIVTALGFFIYGFPPVIVIRALSHIVFAFIGAYLLKKNNKLLLSFKTAIPFVLLLSTIHAVFEVIVSTVYYFTNQSTANFVVVIMGLVGVGTLIHSTVDFIIAAVIWIPLQRVISVPANARIRFNTAKANM